MENDRSIPTGLDPQNRDPAQTRPSPQTTTSDPEPALVGSGESPTPHTSIVVDDVEGHFEVFQTKLGWLQLLLEKLPAGLPLVFETGNDAAAVGFPAVLNIWADLRPPNKFSGVIPVLVEMFGPSISGVTKAEELRSETGIETWGNAQITVVVWGAELS